VEPPNGRLIVFELSYHLAGGIMGLPSASAVNQRAAGAVAVEHGAQAMDFVFQASSYL
jgi:hypothetical protein